VNTRKELPIALIFIGAMIVFVTLGADLLGIGQQGGFGMKQLLLAFAGVVVSFTGVFLCLILGQSYRSDLLSIIKLGKHNSGNYFILVLQIGILVFLISQMEIVQEDQTLFLFAFISSLALVIYQLFKVAFFTRDNDRNTTTISISRANKLLTGINSSTILTSLALLALYLISNPNSYLALEIQEVIYNLRVPRLSSRDISTIQKGYYENLTRIDWFTSEVASKDLRPIFWEDSIDQTPAGRKTGDFMVLELVPSAETLFMGAPFHTNRWGLRDQDYELQKPASTYRIALLGSSYVMGLGVADDETFEWVLEERLNRGVQGSPYNHYEILNFAVSDYTALHQPFVLENKAFSFNPDVVIHVANTDMGFSTWHLAESIVEGTDIPNEELKEISMSAGIEENMTVHDAMRLLKPYGSEILSWSYKWIAEKSLERGILPVWVFIPLVEQEFSSDEVEEIAHLAEAAGFTVLDLSDVFEGHTAESLWRAEYDQHPNAKGHEVIADRLYKEMIENESFFSNTLSP
jgi:hypothetical protein